MKEFETGHGILRYHEMAGEGAPLLFIHGLGCASSSDYPAVAAAIGKRPRWLIDLLGYGFSDRPEAFSYSVEAQADSLLALLQSRNIETADIFGHSMGGAVAQTLATKLGNRCRHLVLTEPNFDSGGGQFSRTVAAYSEVDYIARGHAEIIAGCTGDFALWGRTMATAAAYAVHRSAVSLVEGSKPTWREMLYSLDCSRTVIFGSRSLPDADTEELPSHGVTVHILNSVGHNMAIENPLSLAELIAESLA